MTRASVHDMHPATHNGKRVRLTTTDAEIVGTVHRVTTNGEHTNVWITPDHSHAAPRHVLVYRPGIIPDFMRKFTDERDWQVEILPDLSDHPTTAPAPTPAREIGSRFD